MKDHPTQFGKTFVEFYSKLCSDDPPEHLLPHPLDVDTALATLIDALISGKVKPKDNKAYLARLVRWRSLDFYRKQSTVRAAVDEFRFLPNDQTSNHPEINRLLGRFVADLLKAGPWKDLVPHLLNGLSRSQLADVLGTTKDRVRGMIESIRVQICKNPKEMYASLEAHLHQQNIEWHFIQQVVDRLEILSSKLASKLN